MSLIVVVYPLISLYILKKRQVQAKTNEKSIYQTLTDAIFGLGDWIISGKKNNF